MTESATHAFLITPASFLVRRSEKSQTEEQLLTNKIEDLEKKAEKGRKLDNQ